MNDHIKINNVLSAPFMIEKGMKQGRVLALTLFTLFLAAVFVHLFANDVPNDICIRVRIDGGFFNPCRLTADSKIFNKFIGEFLHADVCAFDTIQLLISSTL